MAKGRPNNTIQIRDDGTIVQQQIPGLQPNEEVRLVKIKGTYVHFGVSNYGRVINLHTKTWLVGFINKGGYRVYDITDVDAGIRVSKLAHRLVAKAFIPNPRHAPDINHINGNKLDNTVDNLEWVTKKENNRHAILTGLRPLGDDNPATKIPNAVIQKICYDYERGKGVKYVAQK